MKKFFHQFTRLLQLAFALFYFIFERLKFRNEDAGIAQVVESFNVGGLEQVALNIYKGFKKNGDKSYVISLSNNVGPMAQQLCGPQDFRIVYSDISKFIRFCAKNNIHTLVFHFTTFHVRLLRLLGFRNYYVVHNTYIWYEEKDWKLLKKKLNSFDKIFAVSDWCKKYFIKKTEAKNVKTILNGIDMKRLTNGEQTNYSRKKLGLKDTDTVFLTVAAFTEGKHQISLIGMMEDLLKVRKDIKFLCVGNILDNNYYSKFKKKLKKSRANKNIILLDYIPQEEIGSFIRTMCDAYLLPSIHEAGVPLTVMEALVCGKPVIMTDFLVRETFPKSDGIFLSPTPYDNIDEITPKRASMIAGRTRTRATKDFVKNILYVTDNLQKITEQINPNDYGFLDKDYMCQQYIKEIILKRN